MFRLGLFAPKERGDMSDDEIKDFKQTYCETMARTNDILFALNKNLNGCYFALVMIAILMILILWGVW